MSCNVSVIIPTYNSSVTLGRALDSVFGQSLLPQEIIIIDDGSGDWVQSKLIAMSYPDSIPICLRHFEENQGPSTARNTGVSLAACRYIAFLDSDDIWFKDKLKVQYEAMDRHQADFSMHNYIENIRDVRNRIEGYSHIGAISTCPISSWNILLRNHATPTVMVLKEKMASFDPSLRRMEDWKCWMEVLSNTGCRGLYIRHSLAAGFKAGIGSSGLSQNIKAMHVSLQLALRGLRSEGKITIVQFFVGFYLEMMKYPLRIIRARLRRHGDAQ